MPEFTNGILLSSDPKIWDSLNTVQSTLDDQSVYDSERMRVMTHAFGETLPPRPAGLG
ncbi:hypothetical protein DESA109040_13745 [Deinococcus saxicola]